MSKFTYNLTRQPDTNIILIILDTHRADRLGTYGYGRNTSPNLDAFASSSIVFDKAIAPAQWTIPSHASMFTGLPPSTHRVTQANSVLDDQFTTFADILGAAGYTTVGFCNNPLVGLIHNDIRKGFDTFYNYSGTYPNIPRNFPDSSLFPYDRIWDKITTLFRKVVDPIQNQFATNSELLQRATHPFFVPLWSRFVHFKGHTAHSIHDVTHFLHDRVEKPPKSPYLLFFNLMETHLPFIPPKEYVSKFAPSMQGEPRAKTFMRLFNNMAMHWLIPIKKPFTPLEAQTISEMYDAEVAYQDHLLGELMEQLNNPVIRDHSLVIITADHGEMLGEHQFMGHGFGVYKELIHVPLFIRLPGQQEGWRVNDLISTTRLFHTILDTAGVSEVRNENGFCADIHTNSLLSEFKSPSDHSSSQKHSVISEAYAPQDAVKMMERSEPELIEPLHTRPTHRAVYANNLKLYTIEAIADRLLTLDDLPITENNLTPDQQQQIIENMTGQLETFIINSKEGQPEGWEAPLADLSNPLIERRLKDLGYMA
jgi:arylsulfatase A-like enzyme